MIEFLTGLSLGAITGYLLADKARRANVMAKLDEWTKPKGQKKE